MNNQKILINNKPMRLISSTSVPTMKRLKFTPGYPAPNLIGVKMVPPALPSAKLFLSPSKNPKLEHFQTPKQPVLKKSMVHVNLMERFQQLSDISKENVIQQPQISFPSDFVIENQRTEQTDKLKELAERGITITPVASKWLKCCHCSAYFLSKNDKIEHEFEVHQSKSQYGLPVVDLNKDETREKLMTLGINNFMKIPNMDQLKNGSSFGIPILPIQESDKSNSLLAMGAEGILSLGSLKEFHK